MPNAEKSAARTADVAKVSLAIAGLLGALLTGVYAYRKQRLEEAAALRADADHLLGRFTHASEQLGHASAAVRLAGVYAMCALADDWVAKRQLCINVLTAYLQIPVESLPPDARSGEREVRRNLIREIRNHLRDGFSDVSWRENQFRFEGAVLTGGDLSGCRLSKGGTMTFHGASIEDEVFHLDGLVVDGGRVWFTKARVTKGGVLRVKDVTMNDGLLSFDGVVVDDGGRIEFDHISCPGGELRPGPWARELADAVGGTANFVVDSPAKTSASAGVTGP